MKKVGDNPPSRFPEGARLTDAQFPWWAAKLKPRQEKAMAFDLIKHDIEYYLPLITKVTRRKDNNKPRKSILPLFPGYICYSAPNSLWRELYATGRVVNFIEIKHQKRFIRELDVIYSAIEHGVQLEPLEVEIVPGMTVEVRKGPLQGVQGVVTRLSNEDKLVLSVEGLGKALMTIGTLEVKPVK